MYIDAQQQYSVAQALVATAVSTNSIDHSQDRNLGIGEPLVVLVTVGVAAAGGGTLQIVLQTDTTSAFGSPVTVAASPLIAAAALGLGAKYVLAIQADFLFNRWSRINYIMATMTSITVTAELTLASMVQNEWYAPAGVTVQ